MQCGEANVVLSVDEPEVCTYALVFATPAACDASMLAAAREEAGLPPLPAAEAGGEEEEEKEHDEL